MKRSEIIRRLREGRCLDGERGRSVSGGLLAELADESLLHIADWLGVAVEPDEPALPDRLNITVHRNHDSHGPAYTLAETLAEDSVSVTVCGPTMEFCKQLADALVAAYNARPLFSRQEIHTILGEDTKP